MNRRMLLCFTLFVTGRVALADSWSPISTTDAPTARAAHSAVFTRIDGTDHMIIWGGQDSSHTPFANTGARWKRSTNVWAATSTTNVPVGREGHPAVWTGHEMLVWGGVGDPYHSSFLDDGGRYDPESDSWQPIPGEGAPSARSRHSAVWTGDAMIVWGGIGLSGGTASGGRYVPSTGVWSATAREGSPSPRFGHTAIWTDGTLPNHGVVDCNPALTAVTGEPDLRG